MSRLQAQGPFTILYRTVVYCTVLYCTVLYCRRGPCDGAGVYCTVLYCTVLYCTAGGGPVTGRVWPLDPVYFPDYTLPRAQRWWQQMVEEFHDLIE